MFSVDFLELGGFRQIDFVQQKVSRRKKKKKKKGGKDLGRFGIQRIKLIHLSSDHTCANLLLLVAAAARVPGTWTPPPVHAIHTHHKYTLSLSFCQGKTTTTTYTCLWSQS
ncbi:unnamed protein product [Sphagnum troendelagicum]